MASADDDNLPPSTPSDGNLDKPDPSVLINDKINSSGIADTPTAKDPNIVPPPTARETLSREVAEISKTVLPGSRLKIPDVTLSMFRSKQLDYRKLAQATRAGAVGNSRVSPQFNVDRRILETARTTAVVGLYDHARRIQTNYMRKNLALSFHKAELLKSIDTTLGNTAKLLESKLEAIKLNTAAPESRKSTFTRRVFDELRTMSVKKTAENIYTNVLSRYIYNPVENAFNDMRSGKKDFTQVLGGLTRRTYGRLGLARERARTARDQSRTMFGDRLQAIMENSSQLGMDAIKGGKYFTQNLREETDGRGLDNLAYGTNSVSRILRRWFRPRPGQKIGIKPGPLVGGLISGDFSKWAKKYDTNQSKLFGLLTQIKDAIPSCLCKDGKPTTSVGVASPDIPQDRIPRQQPPPNPLSPGTPPSAEEAPKRSRTSPKRRRAKLSVIPTPAPSKLSIVADGLVAPSPQQAPSEEDVSEGDTVPSKPSTLSSLTDTATRGTARGKAFATQIFRRVFVKGDASPDETSVSRRDLRDVLVDNVDAVLGNGPGSSPNRGEERRRGIDLGTSRIAQRVKELFQRKDTSTRGQQQLEPPTSSGSSRGVSASPIEILSPQSETSSRPNRPQQVQSGRPSGSIEKLLSQGNPNTLRTGSTGGGAVHQGEDGSGLPPVPSKRQKGVRGFFSNLKGGLQRIDRTNSRLSEKAYDALRLAAQGASDAALGKIDDSGTELTRALIETHYQDYLRQIDNLAASNNLNPETLRGATFDALDKADSLPERVRLDLTENIQTHFDRMRAVYKRIKSGKSDRDELGNLNSRAKLRGAAYKYLPVVADIRGGIRKAEGVLRNPKGHILPEKVRQAVDRELQKERDYEREHDLSTGASPNVEALGGARPFSRVLHDGSARPTSWWGKAKLLAKSASGRYGSDREFLTDLTGQDTVSDRDYDDAVAKDRRLNRSTLGSLRDRVQKNHDKNDPIKARIFNALADLVEDAEPSIRKRHRRNRDGALEKDLDDETHMTYAERADKRIRDRLSHLPAGAFNFGKRIVAPLGTIAEGVGEGALATGRWAKPHLKRAASAVGRAAWDQRRHVKVIAHQAGRASLLPLKVQLEAMRLGGRGLLAAAPIAGQVAKFGATKAAPFAASTLGNFALGAGGAALGLGGRTLWAAAKSPFKVGGSLLKNTFISSAGGKKLGWLARGAMGAGRLGLRGLARMGVAGAGAGIAGWGVNKLTDRFTTQGGIMSHLGHTLGDAAEYGAMGSMFGPWGTAAGVTFGILKANSDWLGKAFHAFGRSMIGTRTLINKNGEIVRQGSDGFLPNVYGALFGKGAFIDHNGKFNPPKEGFFARMYHGVTDTLGITDPKKRLEEQKKLQDQMVASYRRHRDGPSATPGGIAAGDTLNYNSRSMAPVPGAQVKTYDPNTKITDQPEYKSVYTGAGKDIQKLLDGSQALQVTAWSMSMQHGAKDADDILKQAYTKGQSDEDYIRRIYEIRSHKFDNQTSANRINAISQLGQEKTYVDGLASGSSKYNFNDANQAIGRQIIPMGDASRTARGPVKPIGEGETKKRALRATKILMSLGMTLPQAAGMVGNMITESAGMNDKVVGDNGAAYGLCQWHGDRQRWIKSVMGKDLRDMSFDEQVKAAYVELTQCKDYRSAWQALQGTQDPAEAAAILVDGYERPAERIRNKQVRGAHAEELVKDMGAGGDASTGSPTDSSSATTSTTKAPTTPSTGGSPTDSAPSTTPASGGASTPSQTPTTPSIPKPGAGSVMASNSFSAPKPIASNTPTQPDATPTSGQPDGVTTPQSDTATSSSTVRSTVPLPPKSTNNATTPSLDTGKVVAALGGINKSITDLHASIKQGNDDRNAHAKTSTALLDANLKKPNAIVAQNNSQTHHTAPASATNNSMSFDKQGSLTG